MGLFLVAVMALLRVRSRGDSPAFMATRNAALVALGLSLGVCGVSGAVSPSEQASVTKVKTERAHRDEALPVATTHVTEFRRTTTTTSTTLPPTTTTTAKPVVTTVVRYAAPATTRAYTPPPTASPTGGGGAPCHPSYSPCIPDEGTDVDCAGGSGDGPRYVQGPVQVNGPDEYRLDNDHDGVGCES